MYENKSVGFIIINPNQWCPGEIAFGEEIAIKSEFQNKGIGTKTFEMIFEKYKKRGFKRFMGMENKSSKAKSLYNKIGVKESETYVIIEKELN
ncbi:GNAT family N-acetyltransferase [Candidatus Pacearchaeota archaeon]|nr:GNAT family N-acetyltransferase [Candidatus Pacearchaeota archaeon]